MYWFVCKYIGALSMYMLNKMVEFNNYVLFSVTSSFLFSKSGLLIGAPEFRSLKT